MSLLDWFRKPPPAPLGPPIPITAAAPQFVGKATPLGPHDVAVAATALGCEPAALQAVIATETSGSGFDAEGRPRMLFEPHVFYRHLAAGDQELFHRAIDAGLAYPTWGMKPYPADSYPRLMQAVAIDRDKALLSCSWGLGQVMGENYKMVGFPTSEDMVAAALDSEAAQLAMMLAYIRKAGLAPAIISRDWLRFAQGYNGMGNAPAYAAKLRANYSMASPVS